VHRTKVEHVLEKRSICFGVAAEDDRVSPVDHVKYLPSSSRPAECSHRPERTRLIKDGAEPVPLGRGEDCLWGVQENLELSAGEPKGRIAGLESNACPPGLPR